MRRILAVDVYSEPSEPRSLPRQAGLKEIGLCTTDANLQNNKTVDAFTPTVSRFQSIEQSVQLGSQLILTTTVSKDATDRCQAEQ